MIFTWKFTVKTLIWGMIRIRIPIASSDTSSIAIIGNANCIPVRIPWQNPAVITWTSMGLNVTFPKGISCTDW